ncbi:glutathione peroxidase [Salisediminibacterium beveridgei]|uniref:Glutathione peroxidase n=1 Tax=Salisediminibacterium beveridgei TaxID=632773 RepID=A0A1D7QS61_9BACI|nr:glutathione peroxidase [Salisediminibacterium beveridgei]AOM81854.1 Glutathione peroxidase family protein [Salisediminibacterium beveridgei]
MSNLYGFDILQNNGVIRSMADFQGKVILIVNTASKCGLTPQFEELEKLFQTYQENDFVILGFPCNQFEQQEPGTGSEAEALCRKDYGVTFPMMDKIRVNDPKPHPLYAFLKEAQPFQGFDASNITGRMLKQMVKDKYPHLVTGNDIKWNFTKFLVDREGHVVRRFEPETPANEMEEAITELL